MNKTSLSSRIAGLQTLGQKKANRWFSLVTLSDGNNVKYLIKLPKLTNCKPPQKKTLR